MSKSKCPKCSGTKLVEGTDYTHVRPLGKPMSMGSNKIYTFCENCGEIVSIRIEYPHKIG
ncbi:hypothetical protein GCM10007216_32010 [Thalassobacillus devorans]|uniref:Transcription initiation factor TFIIIB n=1 Tax=Thalassobacillus devorans TaxID=279813 RepID=A0ABQ1PKR2_9BACI|nr:transcription elongation factor Elf1 [Thalassobacillus devorans]GGC98820.1 hypothetical protein GCM10007216_32010 [Thalassobacillus devorans]